MTNNQPNQPELEKLRAKGKRSTIAFYLYIFLLIITILLGTVFKIDESKLKPLIFVLICAGIYGVYLQLSMRCPFCNAWIGWSTRLGTPYICPKCKNKLKKSWVEKLKEKETQPASNIHKYSQKKLFGITIIDIAKGKITPQGKPQKHACGIIAIGDFAIGCIAVGKASCGIISIGAASLGIISIGGATAGLFCLGAFSFGVLAIGGIAIGGVTLGGVAIGLISFGGVAIGYYSLGGVAVGKYVFDGIIQNKEAIDLLNNLISFLKK